MLAAQTGSCFQYTDCKVVSGNISAEREKHVCELGLVGHMERYLEIFKCVTTSHTPFACLDTVSGRGV